MSSDSGSDSESNRSGGSPHGPAPTPGHGMDRSASNSPDYNNKSQDASPERGSSQNSGRSGSRSRSGSPESNRSGSGSRSPSAGSHRSRASQRSNHSGRSRSGASNHSGSQRSGGTQRSRSGSAVSKRSGSVASNRSASPGSRRSGSAASKRSGSPGTQRSGSAVSQRSGSAGSRRSGSAASQRSGSAASRRSGSAASNRSRSRSKSAASNRSRSKSAASNKSRSRSKSAGSNRSRSRSKSGASNRSRSRSQSAASNRSRSKSAGSNKSRSRSKSATSHRSKSQSRSRSRERASQDRSGSNSPNLQIDEPASPGDKRKHSSSDENEVVKKKTRVIDSDSDDDGGGGGDKGVSAAAIFGDDADDISSEEEKEKAGSDAEDERRRSDDEDERRSEDDNEQRPVIEDDEDKENEPEPIPETRIDVEIPKISCDLGRDIHFVKLPNFLSVETRPFDPETYEDEIDEEETLDEEGRARLKLKVENTIRWKDVVDDDGNTIKESNARIVRWSDGSYSLHLGSEIFDVYKQPLQGDHNHLFIRQGTGLQGQAVFRTKLSFRPHSTESFTHRKMTLSLADRSQKTSGIKILSQVGVDPDHDRKNLLKKEEEKLRQKAAPSKPRKKDSGARLHASNNAYREEEGSDEDGAISLNAIKNKYKAGAGPVSSKGGAIYSSDEDGSDIEDRRAKKMEKPKALKDSDSSEESE